MSAIVMAAMIAGYVVMTGAWGYLTFRFLIVLPTILSNYGLIIDVTALFIALNALVVLGFLAKPLIPLRRSRHNPIELNRDSEPLLFSYIDALADCIDAPRPERILVDVNANASASFGNSAFGAFGGAMTLTVGLPLVGGLTIRQFSGIVAHELGHFSQGSMVKQNGLLRILSAWMADVALGEDAFDRTLYRLATAGPLGIRLLCRVPWWVTYAVRRLLLVFMLIGHAMSSMTSRELEYDADQFMTHVSGSKHFADTMQSIIMLGWASELTNRELVRFYQDRRLPNNLPSMVIAKARRFTSEQRKKILSGAEKSETESLSTHPLTRKRIDAARSLNATGLVQDDRPARLLFASFNALCRQASEDCYKAQIGPKYDAKQLTDSSQLIRELDKTDKARLAAQRFCQGDALLTLPQFPSLRALEKPTDPNQAMQEVNQLRQQAQQRRDDDIPNLRKYRESRERLLVARQALMVTQIGFEIRDYGELGLTSGDRRGLEHEVRDLSGDNAEYKDTLHRTCKILTKRIELNASLLQINQVAKRIKNHDPEETRDEFEQLIRAGRAMAKVASSIEQLQVSNATLLLGLQMCIGGQVTQEVISRTQRAADDTRGTISDVLTVLHGKPYPFAHGDGSISIAHALCERPPDGDNVADIHFVAEELLGRYSEIQVRIIGQLCHLAERIEKAIGLKRMEQPPRPDDLAELGDAIGKQGTQEEPGLFENIMRALFLAKHGVLGLAVLAIAATGLFFAAHFQSPAFFQIDLPDSPHPNNTQRPESITTLNSDPDDAHLDGHVDVPDNTPPTRSENAASSVSIEDALTRIASPMPTINTEAAGYLLTNPTEDEATQQRIADAAIKIVLTSHDGNLADLGYELLTQNTSDGGLELLHGFGHTAIFSRQPQLVDHVADMGTPQAQAVLLDWLKTRELSRYAQQALASPQYNQTLEASLIAALGDRRNTNRLALIRLLDGVATTAAIQVCEDALNDSDHQVRRGAEKILQEISPTSVDAAASFLRVNEDSPNLSQFLSALSALRQQDGRDDPRREEICAILVNGLSQWPDSYHAQIWQAIDQWPGPAAMRACEQLLSDEDAPLARIPAAIQVVSSQQTARAAELIVRWILKDSDAVEAGLIANGPTSEPIALEYLTHDNADVRLTCCRVLKEVGTRRALSALNSRGNDRETSVRNAAREAFYAIRERINAQEAQPRSPQE